MGTTYPVRAPLLALLLTVLFLSPALIVPRYSVGGTITVMPRHAYAPRFSFPRGGRQLFPNYRLVALYGAPGIPELGALGEQSADASITRVKQLAAAYQPLVTERVYPTLEIIATVASATPTDDGDYSYPIDIATIRQWALRARAEGVYVVLDLQPGRTDFLSQAKQLESVLLEPNVGLALDPEWRLNPHQLPLQQIGQVGINEVNATSKWLADLTTAHKLPQKLFLLHQFQLSMLPDREQLNTARAELAYAIQMDGQGSPAAKAATWQAMLANPPVNVHFGWKNFYKKDSPMYSPAETLQISPLPWYVSYQ